MRLRNREISYRRYKRLSYQHAEDIGKSNRLPGGLFGPQGLDVVGNVLGQQQPERVTADSLHQLLIDVLWAFVRKVRVGVDRGHVPAESRRRSIK